MATSAKSTKSKPPTSRNSVRRFAPRRGTTSSEPPIRAVGLTEAGQTGSGDSARRQAQCQAEPRGVTCRCSRKGDGRSDRAHAAEQGHARNRRRRSRRRHSGRTSTQNRPERAARDLFSARDEHRRRRHTSEPRDHRRPLSDHRRRSWRSPRTRSCNCCVTAATTTRPQQADQQLPDQVDTEQHRDLLAGIGIKPDELAGDVGRKLGL